MKRAGAWFSRLLRPDMELHRLFLGLSLGFGCLFVFLIPPFQSPDEPNHLLRAYQVSEGGFFPENTDHRLGGTLPVSLAAVRDSFLYLKMNYAARTGRDAIFRNLQTPLEPARRAFLDFPNTAVYAPTAYLPQAGAIALLRPLGATPLQLLYAARLANLLVWILLIGVAIRLLPFLKNAVTALALLPASLVMAASANADVVTNGLCWWLVASFLSSGQAVTPSRRLTGLFKQALTVVIVCANKLITLPLVLVYWCDPTPGPSPEGRGDIAPGVSPEAGGSVAPNPSPARRGDIAPGVSPETGGSVAPLPSGEGPGVGSHHFAILLFLALIAALTWSIFAQNHFIPYDQYNPVFRNAQTLNEGVDPARQQAFMLEHPLFFAKTALVSMVRALPSMSAHFAGKFGWEKNYLCAGWLVLLWLLLAALLSSEKNPLSGWQRLWAGTAVFGYAGLFAVTMYALWNPVGAGEISNFQGRYFVPVAVVAALALGNGALSRYRRAIGWVALLILFLANMAMACAIVKRYYAAL